MTHDQFQSNVAELIELCDEIQTGNHEKEAWLIDRLRQGHLPSVLGDEFAATVQSRVAAARIAADTFRIQAQKADGRIPYDQALRGLRFALEICSSPSKPKGACR